MRRRCKSCYACVCIIDIHGGEHERAVERELCRIAKAAGDEGEGGQVGAGDVREEEGKWDRRVLARLESSVAGGAGSVRGDGGGRGRGLWCWRCWRY